jgi:hypothetical protein
MSHRVRLSFRLSGLLGLLLLGGCATGYRPKGFFGVGFSDQYLGPDQWVVTFDASAFTARERIQTYLLFRCAEVTVENGASYFAILEDLRSGSPSSTKPTLIDKPPFPLDRPAREPDQESSPSARAVIRLFRESPEGTEKTYDAREVIRRLAPKMRGG